jgi:hypothetical protein
MKSGASKGQSMIVQFTIFFLIGITLFLGLGNFFKIQSEGLRDQLIGLSTEMIHSHVSSAVVASVDSCVDCGVVENNFKLSRTYAGYFIEVELNDSGLLVDTAPSSKYQYLSSINNLNESLEIEESLAPSVKTINLTYNKNQNRLEVS